MKEKKKTAPANTVLTENQEVSPVAQDEEKILAFWREHAIFEKTNARSEAEEFVFYDGPPFANGLPHYGHLIAGTIKDVIPRYQIMKGKRVSRRWGWDCHGLPVENLIEKELDLPTKKDIENYGIENFNEKARESVERYVDEWKHIVPRLGRFVDMENDYRTMDPSYTESVLAIFKTLYDKNLIYEGYKVMQICPRCETTLSNFEVNQGYQDITDLSVTVKFELVDEPGIFVLGWTTTPWTLPGNVALAVNPEIDYVEVEIGGAKYIVALARVPEVFKEEYKILRQFKGAELIGKSYKPPFSYYTNDSQLKNKENGWKIYGADFVTTEEGTGIVHIAPAFSEDDMKLGQKNNLPFIQHVTMHGVFKPEVTDFAGLPVKPKGDHQATDILIIKYLAAKEVLFSKAKIVHSYPHCWRCATPLLNYATTSWFVRVADHKDELLAINEKVNWVPANIKNGRFGNWLAGARDWAISRSRFWGAPLPVWRCADCGELKVIGATADLAAHTGNHHNNFWMMRHGEAESNVADRISCDPTELVSLTPLGEEQVKKAAEKLKEAKIDLIIASDFKRTRQTAELTAEVLGLSPEEIIYDERLRELNVGSFNGKTWREYLESFSTRAERYNFIPPQGESYAQARLRLAKLLYELAERYHDKNILIVSHGLPLFCLETVATGWDARQIVRTPNWGSSFQTAEVRALNFFPLPHNHHFELDFHRPYIDEIKFTCACGGIMSRVSEVFDCWFESGSMPYGKVHYPFENKNIFDPAKGIGFPADFIAEGMDQTRGWFYSMLVLANALFGVGSYKHVVVNGLVLAEDGQKMSKKLQNYPDPLVLVNKYGADALRFYLMSSPAVHGEELTFSERGVADTYRKISMRLRNVQAFYELYARKSTTKDVFSSPNVLDRWILSRFGELIKEVGEALDRYELDRACRPIDKFIDDLSNWYVRRSRERFKPGNEEDQNFAEATLGYVLNNLAKVIAPIMPFQAELLYQAIPVDPEQKESVHLAAWPKMTGVIDEVIIHDMTWGRGLAEVGLALRDESGIKVRQPLSEIRAGSSYRISDEVLAIVAAELNVKKITISDTLPEGEEWVTLNAEALAVSLNRELTPVLKQEGAVRELIRAIQEERKTENFQAGEVVNTLEISTSSEGQALVTQFEKEIIAATTIGQIVFSTHSGRSITIDTYTFGLLLKA